MAFSTYGDPIAGLQDARVGTWLNTAGVITYPTQSDVMSVQMMSSAVDVVTAELTGDDRITATMSRIIAGEMRIRFAGLLVEVLKIVFGFTAPVTGTTPNRVEQFMITGGQRLPYFGMIGQGLAEEGLGDMLIFAPKVKITSQIQLTSMEYGAFQVAEFTARAVDDIDYGVLNVIRRETSIPLVLPPAGIVTL